MSHECKYYLLTKVGDVYSGIVSIPNISNLNRSIIKNNIRKGYIVNLFIKTPVKDKNSSGRWFNKRKLFGIYLITFINKLDHSLVSL